MTTRELIENAILEACGLLDEEEHEAFTRAFDAAQPQIQAQIRREQRRLSRLDHILPDVEPPEELRSRVLAAVRQAMAASDPAAAHVSNDRSGQASLSAGAGDSLTLMPSRHVSRMWRTAAIGMAAAAVVFAAVTFYMDSKFNQVHDTLARLNATPSGGQLRQNPILWAPDARVLTFEHVGDTEGVVRLTEAASIQHAVLSYAQLPEQPGGYRLVTVDDDGNVQKPIVELRPGHNENVEIQRTSLVGQRLAIVAGNENRIIMELDTIIA